jgi:hypothetical protein
VLIHGGETSADAITSMIKAKASIPSRTASEPTRYTNVYFCAFKRQLDS